MKWASLSAFFAMGGYGFYVWGSYLVTALLICAEIALLISRHRAARRAITATRSRNTEEASQDKSTKSLS